MRKLIRNSLIVSAVAVASATASVGKVHAQTADIDFNGTVGKTCSITKNGDGKIGVSDNNDSILTSRPDESSQGSLTTVTVNCNGSGVISVSPLTPVSTDAIALSQKSGYYAGAELYNDANAASLLTTTSTTINPNGTPKEVYVHAFARDNTNGGTTIPTGTYSFRTKVSVTPQ
ncbi:hypothetical protein PI95_001970 [Hassallia byssoidea VB512170]|uniref:Uncharacterized protein n=1 Tax=Hassallia byssoidea VB512170 TaxID=1304833 RepID=A0A846H2Q3_9CYAN|nr:hypothetical protein [Hassalia byssoidea]NEU71378.1 hypothetical protein [Hassalia byssoidea VB512170]